MSRRRRRRLHRYAMPTDLRSTTEADQLVLMTVALTVIVAALCLARIALASVVVPFSAFMVVSQP